MSTTQKLLRRWKKIPFPTKDQGSTLRKALSLLADLRPRSTSYQRISLPEQPLDVHLLTLSPLYRRSRELFFKMGGSFKPALLSSPRSLSSISLLSSCVEYSPIESEYLWTATDPNEQNNTDALLRLRGHCTSVFHEQNHRLLWKLLPPPPADLDSLQRYLNFAESLVISADVALGDLMGRDLASLFHFCGVVYDPGSLTRRNLKSRRSYRNYLQAYTHATYMTLELFDFKDIVKATQALFPNLGRFAKEAAYRSARLDEAFTRITNLFWQEKHCKEVVQILKNKNRSPLKLPKDPMDNRIQYLICETWFESLGL